MNDRTTERIARVLDLYLATHATQMWVRHGDDHSYCPCQACHLARPLVAALRREDREREQAEQLARKVLLVRIYREDSERNDRRWNGLANLIIFGFVVIGIMVAVIVVVAIAS